MMTPPPIPNRDVDHLNLLAIFHYVLGGLSIVGLGGIYLHYRIMNMVFTSPGVFANAKEKPPFDMTQMMDLMKWFYVVAGILMVVAGVLNVYGGRLLQKRQKRVFSMVISGLNCLQIPFGCALGVFTLIVLSRPSVLRLYDQAAAVPAPTDGAPPSLAV